MRGMTLSSKPKEGGRMMGFMPLLREGHASRTSWERSEPGKGDCILRAGGPATCGKVQEREERLELGLNQKGKKRIYSLPNKPRRGYKKYSADAGRRNPLIRTREQ